MLIGAELYLRKQRGFETSAWMLEHALQDNPSDIVRGNDSRIAYLINNDKNYLDALDKAISESKDGTIANDIALGSQKLGAINPYHVTVQFYTTR